MAERRKSLTIAARDGDRLAELRALRAIIARSITSAEKAGSFREISPLAGKLVEIGKEIDQIEEKAGQIEAEAAPDEPFDPSDV
ncbi:MAG: hypothetical protein QM695_15885 [Micropruina sp.]